METKKTTKTNEKKQMKNTNLVETISQTRGRIFEGIVIKKFSTRVVVEFERVVKIQKYERFFKKKTRIHARLPKGIEVEIGDLIAVQECRPLSKIIHSIVVRKISSPQNKEAKS